MPTQCKEDVPLSAMTPPFTDSASEQTLACACASGTKHKHKCKTGKVYESDINETVEVSGGGLDMTK